MNWSWRGNDYFVSDIKKLSSEKKFYWRTDLLWMDELKWVPFKKMRLSLNADTFLQVSVCHHTFMMCCCFVWDLENNSLQTFNIIINSLLSPDPSHQSELKSQRTMLKSLVTCQWNQSELWNQWNQWGADLFPSDRCDDGPAVWSEVIDMNWSIVFPFWWTD